MWSVAGENSHGHRAKRLRLQGGDRSISVWEEGTQETVMGLGSDMLA